MGDFDAAWESGYRQGWADLADAVLMLAAEWEMNAEHMGEVIPEGEVLQACADRLKELLDRDREEDGL